MASISVSTTSGLYSVSKNTMSVMQGEVGIASIGSDITELKSSTPSHCIILTLWHKERQIAVMAHIDDYTSVRSTINKIELLLRKCFSISINDGGFIIFEMGGCKEISSEKQKNEIYDILKNFNVQRLEMADENRGQVHLNSADGKVSLDQTTNRALEYFQKREYGEFNNFLDKKYPKAAGKDIPFFEAIEACRKESFCSYLQEVDEEADIMIGATPSDVQCFEFDEGLHKDIPGWEKNAIKLEKAKVLTFPLKAERQFINPQSIVKLIVRNMVMGNFSTDQPLVNSLDSEDYSKMLRQAASSDRFFSLFKSLLTHSSSLEIDLLQRGPTSGSVWDIASKYTNDKALEFLNH